MTDQPSDQQTGIRVQRGVTLPISVKKSKKVKRNFVKRPLLSRWILPYKTLFSQKIIDQLQRNLITDQWISEVRTLSLLILSFFSLTSSFLSPSLSRFLFLSTILSKKAIYKFLKLVLNSTMKFMFISHQPPSPVLSLNVLIVNQSLLRKRQEGCRDGAGDDELNERKVSLLKV